MINLKKTTKELEGINFVAFSNNVVVVNTTPHPVSMQDMDGTLITVPNPRGFEAYCCVKESGYIFKLDMFIPAEGTLFLAIYERRQHEERR